MSDKRKVILDGLHNLYWPLLYLCHSYNPPIIVKMLYRYTPKIAMNVPAATAVPITPATLGPMACISRKLVGSASEPTFWDTRAAIGTADTPAEPINGLIFPPVILQRSFPKRTPPMVPKQNATRPRTTILTVVAFKNASALVVAPTEAFLDRKSTRLNSSHEQ